MFPPAPLAQQRHSLRKLHLVIEFSETNHVTAAATAVTVEEIFVGIHQEAWLAISMQRAQPHPSATAKWPRRAPILRVQIAHQGNLLFQVVENDPRQRWWAVAKNRRQSRRP